MPVEETRPQILSRGLDKLDHRTGRDPQVGSRGLDKLDHRFHRRGRNELDRGGANGSG